MDRLPIQFWILGSDRIYIHFWAIGSDRKSIQKNRIGPHHWYFHVKNKAEMLQEVMMSCRLLVHYVYFDQTEIALENEKAKVWTSTQSPIVMPRGINILFLCWCPASKTMPFYKH